MLLTAARRQRKTRQRETRFDAAPCKFGWQYKYLYLFLYVTTLTPAFQAHNYIFRKIPFSNKHIKNFFIYLLLLFQCLINNMKESAAKPFLTDTERTRSETRRKMDTTVSRGFIDHRGFTLIELMVVIVILGILAGLIVPRIMSRPDEARQLKAKIQIESIETALNLYKLDTGKYPSTEQGLLALIEKPETGDIPRNWREGGYLEKGKLPKDPWGNDFVYLSPGQHGEYDISSYGADGTAGGEDKNKDINSWEIE